ncbi:carbohydrate kinase family protein [Chloroflexota bacterium]
MSNIAVIGLGALNIDHLYRVERILDDGEAVVGETASFPGGSAANTIYGLAKLGVSTGFTGVVGDDAGGTILLDDFQEAGVDISQVKVKPQAKTGSTLCLSDSLGKRSIYIMPGANNLLTIDDIDLTYLNQAMMIHVSSFVDEGQFKMLLEVMDKLTQSVKISFSPGALYAAKGLETLAPILAKTYVLFINQSEMQQLTGNNVSAGAESCIRYGCHLVVVTLGKGAGSKTGMATGYIRDGDYEYIVEPSNNDIVSAPDTTGAGDAFATGFLYGMLKGKNPEVCGLIGDTVAHFSTAKMGARQGLPAPHELAQRYQQLYNQEL